MRLATVIGARPQFIKAATVSRACAACGVDEVVVHTGQHFDQNMSGIFFDELGLQPPDHDLGISGGSRASMIGRMLEALDPLLAKLQPDALLVYGDTNSTIAGALAAESHGIPIAHVEAGLRSFNRSMPEESNRIVTDHLSAVCFAPTDAAVTNLAHEGITGDRVMRTGDVMFDAMRHHLAHAGPIVRTLGLQETPYILATVHRAENTDDAPRLRAILDGLGRLTAHAPVVLPLHPRAAAAISRHGIEMPRAVRVIDPVGYLDMLALEASAALIATDSGGVQKEAYFHGVPCLTLRDETEWTELVAAGVNVLTGADADAIEHAGREQLDQRFTPGALYGDGTAAFMIVRALRDRFSRQPASSVQ